MRKLPSIIHCGVNCHYTIRLLHRVYLSISANGFLGRCFFCFKNNSSFVSSIEKLFGTFSSEFSLLSDESCEVCSLGEGDMSQGSDSHAFNCCPVAGLLLTRASGSLYW